MINKNLKLSVNANAGKRKNKFKTAMMTAVCE